MTRVVALKSIFMVHCSENVLSAFSSLYIIAVFVFCFIVDLSMDAEEEGGYL